MKHDAEIVRPTIERSLVVGSRPLHKHQCGHSCNSPYCEDVSNIPCENCGGPPMIVQGYEPWKGR